MEEQTAESRLAKALVELDRVTKERDEARKILTQCWDASGLLCAEWTGKPDQAWTESEDLVDQIEANVSTDQLLRDAEEELEGMTKDRDRAVAEMEAVKRRVIDAPPCENGVFMVRTLDGGVEYVLTYAEAIAVFRREYGLEDAK